jgi:hypothetical protein
MIKVRINKNIIITLLIFLSIKQAFSGKGNKKNDYNSDSSSDLFYNSSDENIEEGEIKSTKNNAHKIKKHKKNKKKSSKYKQDKNKNDKYEHTYKSKAEKIEAETKESQNYFETKYLNLHNTNSIDQTDLRKVYLKMINKFLGGREEWEDVKNTFKEEYNNNQFEKFFIRPYEKPSIKVNIDTHGMPIYYNKKRNKYISGDRDFHKGAAWKVFKEIDGKITRIETSNLLLNKTLSK